MNSRNIGNKLNGSYCYTLERYSCYSDYGPNCQLKNGYKCAKSDGIKLANLSYCISIDN